MKDWNAADLIDHTLAEYEKSTHIVKVDDRFILLKINEEDFYEVCIDHMKSAEDVLRVSLDILGKKWITRDMVRRFISIASREANVNIYPGDNHDSVA